MSEQVWLPNKIFIDAAIKDHERVRGILKRVPQAENVIVNDTKAFTAASTLNFSQGKRILFLTRQKGKFLSICPAFTESAVCCTYRTINVILGCNFDCSYCFLQGYLKNPLITFFVNTENMFQELKYLFDLNPEKIFRFGTGEFTDSLSLDHVLGINKELIEFFGRYPNAALELKTKSIQVEPLLKLEHKGRTIISWSVNTQFIQHTEEHKTATIEERIRAAKKCIEAGYRVGFHFDPLIIHEGWEEGYRETIRCIKDFIPEKAIAWISYGSLRYVPELKREAQDRFPTTPIYSGEFVKGFDGKMRYFAPLRTKLYETVHRFVQEAFPAITPYICMEPEHIWEKSFGGKSYSTSLLTENLDLQTKENFLKFAKAKQEKIPTL